MRRFLILALAFWLSATAHAAEKKPLTVDDMWAVQRVGAPVLSPDGKTAACTVSVYDAEENRLNADIWVVPPTDGAPRRLTANKASDSSPAWSPDGKRIAFVSKRDGDSAAQLYVISVDGGEAERATEMPLAVSNPKWFPDGKRVAFVSHVIAGAESPAETKKALEAREKNKVKARVSDNRLYRFWDRWLTDNEYPRIFALDLDSKKVTDLIPGSKRYFDLQEGTGSFDISPDGSKIAFEANSSPEPYRTLNTDIFLVGAAGGEVQNLTAGNPAQDSDPVFSPDGKTLAYGLERKADGWPDRTRLAVLDFATGNTNVLTEDWDYSPTDWTWTPDGASLVFHAEKRGRTSLYTLAAKGGAPKEIYRGGTTSGAEATPGGEVVFSHHSLTRPPEIAAVGSDGTGFRLLTGVNNALVARIAWGDVKELTFKAPAMTMFRCSSSSLPASTGKRIIPSCIWFTAVPSGLSAIPSASAGILRPSRRPGTSLPW